MRAFTIVAIGMLTAGLGATPGSAQERRAPGVELGQEIRAIVRKEIRRALEEAREDMHEEILEALRAHGGRVGGEGHARVLVVPHGEQPEVLHLELRSELKSPHGKVFAPRDQRDDDKGCRCCCCCKNRGQDPDEDSEKAKPKGKIGFVAPSVRLHLPAVRQLQGLSVGKTRVVPTTLPVMHLEMLPLRKATSLLRVELRPSLEMRVEPQRKVIRRKIQI